MPVFLIIIVTLVIIFHIRLGYLNRRNTTSTTLEQYIKDDFEAGLTRAAPIDENMFIRLKESDFPFRLYDETNLDEQELIKIQKRVRLNLAAPVIKTDLPDNIEVKKRFGVANLQIVINGEENFTKLIQNLNKWAKLLIERGDDKDAERILEKAVYARSDISETYILLFDLYRKTDRRSKIEELRKKAESLSGIAKAKVENHIENTLN